MTHLDYIDGPLSTKDTGTVYPLQPNQVSPLAIKRKEWGGGEVRPRHAPEEVPHAVLPLLAVGGGEVTDFVESPEYPGAVDQMGDTLRYRKTDRGIEWMSGRFQPGKWHLVDDEPINLFTPDELELIARLMRE